MKVISNPNQNYAVNNMLLTLARPLCPVLAWFTYPGRFRTIDRSAECGHSRAKWTGGRHTKQSLRFRARRLRSSLGWIPIVSNSVGTTLMSVDIEVRGVLPKRDGEGRSRAPSFVCGPCWSSFAFCWPICVEVWCDWNNCFNKSHDNSFLLIVVLVRIWVAKSHIDSGNFPKEISASPESVKEVSPHDPGRMARRPSGVVDQGRVSARRRQGQSKERLALF